MSLIKENLIKDINEINSQNILFHKKFILKTGNSWAQWSDYQEWINYNISSLDSVKSLCDIKKYRDCYIILRSVFESYFLIKLSMLAEYFTFELFPKTGETPEQLVKRASDEKNALGTVSESVELIDNKYVRIIYKVLPIQGTNKTVSNYYFINRDYNPDTHYLHKILAEENSFFDNPKELFKKASDAQKNISRSFLTIGKIKYFLSINDMANERQQNAIDVHYNYLSKFVHGTVNSYNELSERRSRSYMNNLENIDGYNSNHEILILLYCTFLSSYFLQLQLDYFGKDEDLEISKKDIASIKSLLEGIETRYDFFWFIYNNPSSYDKFTQEWKHKDTSKIPYYSDPFKRLKELQLGMRRGSGEVYSPPGILVNN